MWPRHLLFRRRVFAIKYRTIPCNQPLAKEAKQVGKLLSDPHAGQKPAGLNCASQVTRHEQLLVAAPQPRRQCSMVQSNQRRQRGAGGAHHS
jgi:hypothetical protein